MEIVSKEELAVRIGKRIRELRKEHGINQRELADMLGIVHTTVSSYEVGRITPDILILYQLSRVLEVDIQTFFELDGEIPNIQVKTNGQEIDTPLTTQDSVFLGNFIEVLRQVPPERRESFHQHIHFSIAYFSQQS